MNPTSANTSHPPVPAPSGAMPIRLVVKGLGHVPSFKNGKMLTRGRLITDPKKQAWMDRCIKDLESQLRSLFLMRGIEIRTAVCPHFLIASLVPLDDSLRWIVSHSASWRKVKKGDEGAEIVIEKL